MEDVKVAGISVRGAPHCRSLALSLRRIDLDWRSQLLVEYSKDLDACMNIDEPGRDDEYIVEDVIIYSYGIIFLTKASELKKKLLHATHEGFLAMHFDAYFALIEEFTWEEIQHDLYQHMDRCIAQMILERLTQPFPYSLEVRESIQRSQFSSRT